MFVGNLDIEAIIAATEIPIIKKGIKNISEKSMDEFLNTIKTPTENLKILRKTIPKHFNAEKTINRNEQLTYEIIMSLKQRDINKVKSNEKTLMKLINVM